MESGASSAEIAIGIEEGKIVKVHGTGTSFDDAYGVVAKVSPGEGEENIGITFGRDMRYMFGSQFKKDGIMLFSEKNLKMVEDFPSKIKAELLFKDSYSRLYTLNKPLNKDSECGHKDCPKKAEKRAMINVWGSVYEVDVCPQHFEEFNGHLIDDFPWKK